MRQEEYVYEEKRIGQYHVKVVQDSDPENPRTAWDNFGHMICFVNRYSIGDKHNMSGDELKEIIESENTFSLPVFVYIHSGITVNTSGFSCPWDSGQAGYIYVTKEEIRKEYGVKKISAKLTKRVYDILKSEVETYDQYLTGSVYGFVVEHDEKGVVDSCSGFYGSVRDCLQEGIASAEYARTQDISEHVKTLKSYIKNRVPVIYRLPCPIKQ